MKHRTIHSALILITAFAFLGGCKNEAEERQKEQQQAEARRREIEAAASAAAAKAIAQDAEARQRETAAIASAAAAKAIVDERARVAREAADAAERERTQIAEEKANLLRDPSSYLDASDIKYHDKGILNSYRQLTGFTARSKARWAVQDIEGEVDWLNDEGHKIASVTFKLTGTLPPNASKEFSERGGTLSSGTIQGSASRAQVRFMKVALVEAPQAPGSPGSP